MSSPDAPDAPDAPRARTPRARTRLFAQVKSFLPSLVALTLILTLANLIIPNGLVGGTLSSLPVTAYTFTEYDAAGKVIKAHASQDAGQATALRTQINSLPENMAGCGHLLGVPPSSDIDTYAYTFTLFRWTIETVMGPLDNCGQGVVQIAGLPSYRVHGVPGIT